MPALLRIRGGIVNRKVGPVPDINGKVFQSQKASFKAETLAKGFDQPWGMAFLPDGRIIFTERNGNIRFLNKDGSVSEPVKGTPSVFDAPGRRHAGYRAASRFCQEWLDLYLLFDRAAGLSGSARRRNRAQYGAADHDLCGARQGQRQQ